ncbi:MAG TPA: MotA/TolQ/ExbB proton channel family protein [bacterium]|nr:MotA/TolQ/ExbB proton channel family protein [bacterium]
MREPSTLGPGSPIKTSLALLCALLLLACYCWAQAPGEVGESTSSVGAPPGLAFGETTTATSAVATWTTVSTTGTPTTASPSATPSQAAPVAEKAGGLGLIKLFKSGGPVMWPLLLSLLIGIIFMVERGVVFWKGSINARVFMMRVNTSIDKGDVNAAMAACDASRGPIPAVIKAGLLRWDKGRKHVERAIETVGAGAMSKLERGLPVLASVANIAPLMGFLGTVTGMIRSFGVIAKAGLSNPGLVAQGISEALITTASGLIIAIPTLAAYNYFTSVVAKTALQMDESTSQLLDQLQ